MNHRRFPLWLTLVPLGIAVLAYWWLWSGWARDFKAAVQPWLPEAALSVSGFPYRLEIAVDQPRLVTGDIVRITATAAAAQVNRGPWAPRLTIVNATEPRFAAAVGPGIGVTIAGKIAATSISTVDGRLARLSAVIEAARLGFAMTPMPVTADTLELHLRERDPGPGPKGSPSGGARGQLVVAGTRARLAGGDALTLAGDLIVTGPGRLLGYDAWAPTGTLEVTGASIADAHGEVASLRATIVTSGRNALRYAGVIETICPLGVAAAVANTPAPVEKRLRAPVRLAFEGISGDMKLSGMPVDIATRAVRAQLPACPVIRGRG